MPLVLAYTIVFSSALLAFELVALPIPSELSSVPDLDLTGFGHGEGGPSFLSLLVKTARATAYPGIPAAGAFAFPTLRAVRILCRSCCQRWGRQGRRQGTNEGPGSPHGQRLDPRVVWRVYPRELTLVAWLIVAAGWELTSVLVLRSHRLSVPEKFGGLPASLRPPSGASLFCRRGPFALSRHPINLGLLGTVAGFAAADGSAMVAAAAVLFSGHLVSKTLSEEEWLRSNYGEDTWRSGVAHIPLLAPPWCLALGAVSALFLNSPMKDTVASALAATRRQLGRRHLPAADCDEL